MGSLLIFLIFFSIIVFTITLADCLALCDTHNISILLTPKFIYNTIKVNWFGAIILYIFYIISCPIFFILSLCVIGRRDK